MKEVVIEHRKVLVHADIHFPFQDQKILDLIYLFADWWKPDTIIHGGDLMDFYRLSKFSKDPSPPDMLDREFEAARNHLKILLLLAQEVHLIEGNHEARLNKYLNDCAPELKSLTQAATGEVLLTVENILGLNEMGIEFIKMRGREAYKRYNDILVGHFNKVSKHSAYTAKALVEDKGISIIQHHTHRGGVYYKTVIGGQLVGIENFCTCDIHPSYIQNPNWQQGFTCLLLDRNGKRFTAYPICIVDYKFIFGDKKFSLN